MALTWKLNKTQAVANVGNWEATVTPVKPSQGLRVLVPSSAAWQVLCVAAEPAHSLPPEEIYVRETDLISRFDQSPKDQFAFQLNWRLLKEPAPRGFGVELWVSIQTDLLDSTPVISLTSRSPGELAWKRLTHAELVDGASDGQAPSTGPFGPAAFVANSDEHTGVWMIEPSDQRQVHCPSSPEDAEQQIQLFGQFMEKGVIRRARLRFCLVPGALQHDDLQQLYAAFCNSPLPLTA